jgi:thiopeptide-type bacteriocin biosynthesis protein
MIRNASDLRPRVDDDAPQNDEDGGSPRHPWRQATLHFADYAQADAAGRDLGAVLVAAENDRLLNAWWFIRKSPCWRLRFQPTSPVDDAASKAVYDHLNALRERGRIAGWSETLYEPETFAFGGPPAMQIAHRLFHQDSRHLLTTAPRSGARARALSILACVSLMRAAGQDWYEQGDIWARVAEHRRCPPGLVNDSRSMEPSLTRLLSAQTPDTDALGKDADLAQWIGAFAATGRDLGRLAHDGTLQRGLRAVLTHHIIFHWNRAGLSHDAQAVLAGAASAVVLG